VSEIINFPEFDLCWLELRGGVPAHVLVFDVMTEDTLMAKSKVPAKEESLAQRLLARQKTHEGRTSEGFDQELLDQVPAIHELLTVVLRDDKKTLDPASLIIYCQSGSFHACLSHKSLKLKWWGEGPTLKGALVALERAVKREEGQDQSAELGSNTGQP
jgi:hypothetical protein